jgi:hypothetical protein
MSAEAVSRGQRLSHYRGQIEPLASLPCGAMVGCFREVMSEEWWKTAEVGVGDRYPTPALIEFHFLGVLRSDACSAR